MTSDSPVSTQADSYSVVDLKIYAEDIEATSPPDLPVFNNGLQQVRVTVRFELHKNGSPYSISIDDAKRAVHLTLFESVTPIPAPDPIYRKAICCGFDEYDYEYNLRYLNEALAMTRAIDEARAIPEFETTHLAVPARTDADTESFVFNDMTFDTAFFRSALQRARVNAAAGDDATPRLPLTRSARVKPSEGKIVSDTTILDYRHTLTFYVQTYIAGFRPAKIPVGASVSWPLDSTTPLAHTGETEFRSSVNIVPVNFPDVGMEGFGDRIDTSSALQDHKYESNAKQVDVCEQYLTVKLNHLTVPLREVLVEVRSLHRHSGKAGSREWAMTYFGQPGSTEVEWEEGFAEALHFGNSDQADPFHYLPVLMKTAAPRIREPSKTRVVIGALMGDQHYQFRDEDNHNVPDETESLYAIEDAFGNMHGVAVVLKDNEFNYVRLQEYTR